MTHTSTGGHFRHVRVQMSLVSLKIRKGKCQRPNGRRSPREEGGHNEGRKYATRQLLPRPTEILIPQNTQTTFSRRSPETKQLHAMNWRVLLVWTAPRRPSYRLNTSPSSHLAAAAPRPPHCCGQMSLSATKAIDSGVVSGGRSCSSCQKGSGRAKLWQ